MAQNILLIQHDPGDARAVREALINSSDAAFHVEWVRSCFEGVSRLAGEATQGAPDIAAVLVDLVLPDTHGIETFDLIFQAAPQIPILVLSTSQNEDIAKTAVQRGAQDYLLKARLDGYLLPKALRNMIERAANAEALFEEKERAQVTLDSIGDAVISSDVRGNVTYLNTVAESMTGWSRQEAAGRRVEEVFRIIDATTREPAQNPMAVAVEQNKTVSLTPNCVLIRRDGVEVAVEDSAAPIHDRRGRVTGAVMVFHDVSAARALSVRMSYLAQHDSLTGLPNRSLLDDRLTQAISLAQRHKTKLAVLFLDIDRFKQMNDSLGHDIGDRLLRSVAQRLLGCVRGSDTVSRQGGDEFVILLSEVTQGEDAAGCAKKVLLALGVPHTLDEHSLNLTASIGIAICPDDGTDAETLMKHADSAMYHAKDNGRNNYQFFEPDMNLRAVERQSLESGLRHALEQQQFVLHYQPIVDLQTNVISGVEALIRWRHPKRGLLLAAQFVPIAEGSDLIVAIGRWVLREACRQVRAWLDAGILPIRVAINVSAMELRDPDFVAGVRAALQETGIPPHLLELELTEPFLVQDAKSAAAVLGALKDTGVQLALDDFGTGYSSLGYLRRFPIDTLKIDQGFVHNIERDSGDARIIAAVISMAKSLRMRVAAEGVETREQLTFLQRQSCSEGQGNYFSRPRAARGITRLLERDSLIASSQSHRATGRSFKQATANSSDP